MKFTSGEEIVRNIDVGFTLELTAEATVLTVDAGSMATSKSFTITSSSSLRTVLPSRCSLTGRLF